MAQLNKNNIIGREMKLSAQRSRVKISNQSHDKPLHRCLPRMGAMFDRCQRGYTHNGKWVPM
jgi:hypothetical protein